MYLELSQVCVYRVVYFLPLVVWFLLTIHIKKLISMLF